MREGLFAHNRVLREKELVRQDANLVRRIRSAKCKIDAKIPRSMSTSRNSKRVMLIHERQGEISKHNQLLLGKLKQISSRPNQSSLF
jgi:Hemingway/CFA97